MTAAVGGFALAGCAGLSGETTAGTDGATTQATTDATAADTTATDATRGSTPTAESDTTATPVHASYETTVVRATTPDGDVLGSVTAAVADTPDLRYLGLSDTASLPADRGMLFVFETVGDRTFVMREMDFGLDIVYADAEGVITRIHHASAPGPNENGNEQRYPGRGQYVLEVNYGWTTEHGVEEGDVLRFEL